MSSSDSHAATGRVVSFADEDQEEKRGLLNRDEEVGWPGAAGAAIPTTSSKPASRTTSASSSPTRTMLPAEKVALGDGDFGDDSDAGLSLCASLVARYLGRGSAVLWLFTACQILIFYDRGMVAGFLPAVQRDVGSLSDTQAGLLGSGFIFGYMLACPLFAFFSKQYSAYKLMSLGLFLWASATLACGLSGSFLPLLAARILTGVGEASFAGLAPTCIDDVAPVKHRTIWLSFFFAGIPLGSALGYVAGGYFAKMGWHYGFLFESIAMLPLVLIVFGWQSASSAPNGSTANDTSAAEAATARRPPAVRRTNSWARIPRFEHATLVPRPLPTPTLTPSLAPAQAAPALTNGHGASSQFSRSISTPALHRVDDLNGHTSLPASPDRRAAGGEVEEEKYAAVHEPLSASLPSATTVPVTMARRDSRARTPKAMERRYIVPDPSNPFHAPGGAASGSTAATAGPSSAVVIASHTSSYAEATFAHVPHAGLAPDAYLPSPKSFHPHYEAQQAAAATAPAGDMFVTDVVTLLTDGVYIVVVLGYAALAFVIGALSFWGPVDFSKDLHIGLGRSTRLIGLITFCCGLGGTFFGGWCMDARGGAKGIFAVISALELCCVFTTVSIGFALAAVCAVDLTASMACLAIADFFLFATGAPVNASLLSVAPRNMRSLAMAMSILLMHALGDLPSPFLMGLVTDQLGSIPLALVCLILWLLWTVLFWGIGVRLARARAEAFKAQLRRDMSVPASERSALLARRGSTGSFYARNPDFYDAIQARPSQNRPFQYYDSDGTVHQPYPQHAFHPPPPVSVDSMQAQRARADWHRQARTPPHQPRSLNQARIISPIQQQAAFDTVLAPPPPPGTLPIFDRNGVVVGFAQTDQPQTQTPPQAYAPFAYQDADNRLDAYVNVAPPPATTQKAHATPQPVL